MPWIMVLIEPGSISPTVLFGTMITIIIIIIITTKINIVTNNQTTSFSRMEKRKLKISSCFCACVRVLFVCLFVYPFLKS